MKLKEAITILENHNKWRRNDKVPNDIVMAEPKELGVAIDTVVSGFKKLTISVVNNSVCKHNGRTRPDPLGGFFCVECGTFVKKQTHY